MRTTRHQPKTVLPAPLLTVKQVMAALAIKSRVTLWKMEKSGHLTPIRIGSAVRYRPEDVHAFMLTGGACHGQ